MRGLIIVGEKWAFSWDWDIRIADVNELDEMPLNGDLLCE